MCVHNSFPCRYRHHMDDETEWELTFVLRHSLRQNPFVVKNLNRRRGADVFEEIAKRQAKDILKRWELKRKPGLKSHEV